MSGAVDDQPVPAVDVGLAPGTAVAVTGPTGFIGGRLVERLKAGGANVTCLVRDAGAAQRLAVAGTRVIGLDLADAAALEAALSGIACVFHCAYDWHDAEWNVRAMRALIAVCARGGQRLVHVSSFVVYQLPAEGKLTELTPLQPAPTGYAQIKCRLEEEVLRATREAGLRAAVLQPTLVYGPNCHPFTIEPADQLRYGTVVLPADGAGLCNVVYVDDVADAMLRAAVSDAALGERFLISGPAPVTWREFYERIARAVEVGGPQFRPAGVLARENSKLCRLLRLVRDPERVIRRLAATRRGRRVADALIAALPQRARMTIARRIFAPVAQRPGFTHVPDAGRLWFLQLRSAVDCEKARRAFGYAPRFDYAAGMVPTADYLRSRYAGCGDRSGTRTPLASSRGKTSSRKYGSSSR